LLPAEGAAVRWVAAGVAGVPNPEFVAASASIVDLTTTGATTLLGSTWLLILVVGFLYVGLVTQHAQEEEGSTEPAERLAIRARIAQTLERPSASADDMTAIQERNDQPSQGHEAEESISAVEADLSAFRADREAALRQAVRDLNRLIAVSVVASCVLYLLLPLGNSSSTQGATLAFASWLVGRSGLAGRKPGIVDAFIISAVVIAGVLWSGGFSFRPPLATLVFDARTSQLDGDYLVFGSRDGTLVVNSCVDRAKLIQVRLDLVETLTYLDRPRPNNPSPADMIFRGA